MKKRAVASLGTAALLLAAAQADIQNDVWTPVPQVVPSTGDTGMDVGMPEALPGPAPDGAVAAMLAIDPKYVDGIVLVTARGGTPVPRQWIVVARDDQDLGTLHKITVADGQVIADVLSLNAYESFRQDVAINPTAVQIDSGHAFSIAEPIAAANGQVIGHVDYALTVRGTDASPIWTLNCFGINGRFLGKIVMLATTGVILFQPGFPASPP